MELRLTKSAALYLEQVKTSRYQDKMTNLGETEQQSIHA